MKKSTGVAYILLVLCGLVGVHQFYLGRILHGVIYLVSWLSFGILPIIFVLVDLFLIPHYIRKANEGDAESKALKAFRKKEEMDAMKADIIASMKK